MRVVAGSLKNRLIVIPKDCPIRPTSEKLRAAVFNIVQGAIEGAHVLDLFCGSGAIGIEAMSRGAATCTFVDNNALVLACLKKNLATLGLTEQGSIIHKDVVAAIEGTYIRRKQYAFIYIDPPYADTERLSDILLLIHEKDLLSPEGAIFLEVRKGSFVPESSLPLTIVSKRTYSDSDLYCFQSIMS